MQYRIVYEYLLSFSDDMMDLADITEFRTTWNNELFLKNKSAILAAKKLIKKSIIIAQIRLCRQLKYVENDLSTELQAVEHDRQILKNSLAENLQKRLKVLQNEIDNYNIQIKNLVKQEKDYWKQLEQIIAKRTNFHEPTTNKLPCSSNTQPVVVVNATFVIPVDQNNENIPPLDCTSLVKVPKIRKKKKCIS